MAIFYTFHLLQYFTFDLGVLPSLCNTYWASLHSGNFPNYIFHGLKVGTVSWHAVTPTLVMRRPKTRLLFMSWKWEYLQTMKVTLQHKPCDRLYSFVCFAATVTRILTQKVPRIPLGACIVSGAVSLYTLTDKEPLLSSDSRRCGWIIYGGIPTHWLGK